MSNNLLNKAANDPKLSRKRDKNQNTQLRTVSELFSDENSENVHKEKRGRPWVKDPARFAREQCTSQEPESDQEEEAPDGDSSDFDSSCEDDDQAPELELADLENANFLSLVQDAPTTDKTTKRLALLHFDWDNSTPEDIFILLESFLPPNRHIRKVTVYPSSYGIQRMKEEVESGPKELKISDSEASDNDVCDPDDKKSWRKVSVKVRKSLRDYQLQRLKYYYAIIEFDSEEAAQEVYQHCDGLEYQSSGVCLDLRYVGEKEVFDISSEYAHLMSECSEVNKSKYKPRKFQTKALSSTRISLDWDKTPGTRTDWFKSYFVDKSTDSKQAPKDDEDRLGQYFALSSSGSSTAASSDVDDPGPAPNVPRIRKHRPRKVPATQVRALLLGQATRDSSENMADEAESSSNESYDLNSSSEDDQKDRKASKSKKKTSRRPVKAASDDDDDLDFDQMDTRMSDDGDEEDDEDQSNEACSEDEEETEKMQKSTSSKVKLSRRAKLKEKIRRDKSEKLQRAETNYRLWRHETGDFVDDPRFDSFLTNPEFSVSQTHQNYEDAKDFMLFMRERPGNNSKNAKKL